MTKIRALMVDDEPLARKRVRALLGEQPDIEIVGECDDGEQAVSAIREQRPDLVLLDIQMPRLDGLGVVEAIEPDHMPAVIFVTAYDQHAVRAFEINAIDYVLKPFDAERFGHAVRRARQRIEHERSGDDEELKRRLLGALRQLHSDDRPVDRLVIKARGRISFLPVDEIDWIEAAGKYARIHAGAAEHLMRESMNRLEAQLDPDRFVRIHRSTIVNLDSIRELEPMFHGEYRVFLKNGAELTLSRGYRSKLRERIGDLL